MLQKYSNIFWHEGVKIFKDNILDTGNGRIRAIQTDNRDKDNKWTQSIAVGSKPFIEKMKGALGFKARGRKIICADDTFELRDVITPYGKAHNLNSANTFL